jgi:hypothetical protein
VLIAETADVPGRETVFLVAAWTILLSIYLHGLSAAPVSERYGVYVDGRAQAERTSKIPELPIRLPPRHGSRGAGPRS